MKAHTMKKLLLSLCAACAIAAQAAELNQVVLEKSRITFVSKQMGVPVNGGFRKFEAQFSIDPAKPEAGKAKVDVDLASIDAGSSDADTEVKGKGWLDIAAFPKAGFVSSSVKALGGGRYEARGPLTIKGISRDTVIPFSLRNDGAGAWLEGGFTLPRLQFKIGEGEWSDTSTVADEVQVKFKLFLTPKK
jgi:polyisoprenoid-binding protein YceI